MRTQTYKPAHTDTDKHRFSIVNKCECICALSLTHSDCWYVRLQFENLFTIEYSQRTFGCCFWRALHLLLVQYCVTAETNIHCIRFISFRYFSLACTHFLSVFEWNYVRIFFSYKHKRYTHCSVSKQPNFTVYIFYLLFEFWCASTVEFRLYRSSKHTKNQTFAWTIKSNFNIGMMWSALPIIDELIAGTQNNHLSSHQMLFYIRTKCSQ